jgi:hypothetical protein
MRSGTFKVALGGQMLDVRQHHETGTGIVQDAQTAWTLSAESSDARLSTRHWFWGPRRLTVTPVSGLFEFVYEDPAELELSFEVPRTKAAPVKGHARADRFRRSSYGRFVTRAEVTIEERATAVELELRDYGTVADRDGGARRFAAVAILLNRDFLDSAQLGRRTRTGADAKLHADLVLRQTMP